MLALVTWHFGLVLSALSRFGIMGCQEDIKGRWGRSDYGEPNVGRDGVGMPQ